MKNRRKLVNRIIFAIILLIVSLFTLRAFYMAFPFLREPSTSFLIRSEILTDEEVVEALIIREEKILTEGNKNRKINKEKPEGYKLAKGDNVFRYYSEAENRKLEEIEQNNREIEEHLISKQENYSKISNGVIDKKIEKRLIGISNINHQSDILKIEKEISEDILEKAKSSGDFSKEGSKIKELIDKNERLKKGLNDNTKEIVSPFAGILSYRVDGYETELSNKKLDEIDSKAYDAIKIKPGNIIAESNSELKIVNNFQTILLVRIKSKEANKRKVGDEVKIRIGGENEIPAKIVNIKDLGKDYRMIAFRVRELSLELLRYRKIKIEIIWWEEKGLKIRNESLLKKGDFYYIVRDKLGIKEQILVKKLRETDEYSLIENYTTEELKKLGINISEDRKTIKENDEILVKPDKYQIRD